MSKNGLVYGKHAIHENKELEEGFEIWTNSWSCRAFFMASEVAIDINKNISKKFMILREKLLENILDKFWSQNHFIKTIKTNGDIIEGKVISIIAPVWAGIITEKEKMRKISELP